MRYKYSKLPDMEPVLKKIYEDKVVNVLMFANILSLFQCYNYFIIYKLRIAWLKSKQAIHHDETFITTGYYKWYILQLFFVFF